MFLVFPSFYTQKRTDGDINHRVVLTGESETLTGESETLTEEAETLTGEAETLTGESETLTGESVVLTAGHFMCKEPLVRFLS